jgi:adenine-specific DNA methylase
LIPKECKRLAEVDFPIAAVNAACSRENNRKSRTESRHISLLHTWWARRPLASCRAILLGILLPNPTDPLCPEPFKRNAQRILGQFRKIGDTDLELQRALLAFIAEVSDADLIGKRIYIAAARELVKKAWDESPHVFDPFAGGGSIPLEALRLGCDATASELNTVAWFLLKITLEWSARKGPDLIDLFEKWSNWVLKEAGHRLETYYPVDDKKRRPLVYLWARKVRCEAPGCGVAIPLVRNLWLSKESGHKKALRISYKNGRIEPEIEVFEPEKDNEVSQGTVSGFKATCPRCFQVTSRERVQVQLREQQGGAANSILLAVVRKNPDGRGKDYYQPTPVDLNAIQKAENEAKAIYIEMPATPPSGDTGFRPRAYGITNWVDVLTPRQKFSRWVIYKVIEDALKEAAKEVGDQELLSALAACLYTVYSLNGKYHTSLCLWAASHVGSIFMNAPGIPMRADFVESSPLSTNCEGLAAGIKSVKSALQGLVSIRFKPSSPIQADALEKILPRESAHVLFTDPPYYDSIPYAHLSDFFYGWLRMGLKSWIPKVFDPPETEKAVEITKNLAVKDGGGRHDAKWYENRMAAALSQSREVLVPDGIGSVIFAHKSTEGWESLVSALIRAGWLVTASWPIMTEWRARMRAKESAALAASVHLICRPRPRDAPVGDWGNVLQELPKRVGDWMERLQSEGIRGADLVFASIGPALEIYSRYSKVVDAEEREIPLGGDPEASEPHRKGFLSYVWEVVGRTALEQVLGTPEARARNSTAGALEEDARLTALFLWTLQSTNGNGARENKKNDEDIEEDEEEETPKKKRQGYTLIFDVVRRFAQPLGIHLPEWEGRVIETEKGIVRLLSVKERAKQLFGEESISVAGIRIEEQARRDPQMKFDFAIQSETGTPPQIKGHRQRKKKDLPGGASAKAGTTTLDRVHAAMLLQASGQTNALRALLKAEQDRGPDFIRLANALSALYPKQSEEKRLLDAMLLAIPR